MPDYSQMLASVTGGKRYCFVIMSYHEGYQVFSLVRSIVAETTGLECIRADDIPGAGSDLRGKIHAAIDAADLVIADISSDSPNVYYEVGYSVARNKAILLFVREGVQIPTDLLGVETIRYADDRVSWTQFQQTLRGHLVLRADLTASLLRSMAIPLNPSPSFILTNPKTPLPESRLLPDHPPERATWGDYLGIVGILSVFGSVYGERHVPEVLAPPYVPDDLIQGEATFYLLGSPKTNRFTSRALKMLQQGRAPNWRFGPVPGEDDIGDYAVQLSGSLEGQGPVTYRAATVAGGGAGSEDYGLIVRGPNPRYPERMMMVLAGPRSLGTGAACLAATRSKLIGEIAQRLAGKCDLANREITIWVLVKGKIGLGRHLDLEGVTVVDAGVYS